MGTSVRVRLKSSYPWGVARVFGGVEVTKEVWVNVSSGVLSDIESYPFLEVSTNGTTEATSEDSVSSPEVSASASARDLAQQLGIDLRDVTTTRSDGKITVSDVRAFAESRIGPPAEEEGE